MTISGQQLADDSYVGGSPITIAGQATDPAGVKQVRVAVFDTVGMLYLASNGTWSIPPKYLLATLTQGADPTTASYTYAGLTLHPGSYRIDVSAVNKKGTIGATVSTNLPVEVNPAAPAYLTIMFGRGGYQPSVNCQPMPGSLSLQDALDYLSTRGMIGTIGVTTDRTLDTERYCDNNYILYPSWADLTALQASDGATVVSQSKTYTNWASARTADEFTTESCDTLPTFEAHGFSTAWGMFDYPNNNRNPGNTGIAPSVVTNCFAFGREYSNGKLVTTKSQALAGRNLINTMSVTSGRCNNTALPCNTVTVANNRLYTMPAKLATMLNPDSDQYGVVQFYRFVQGASNGQGTGVTKWDCTSPDPRNHWVTQPEVYCFNDFETAINMIAPSVTVTDPATVADAWGRVPGS